MKNYKNYFGIPKLLIYFCACFANPSLADGLEEGKWGGSYTLHQSETVDVVYDVKYIKKDEKKQLKIKMTIELDSKYTYKLEDVVIEEDEITFKMKNPDETKTCKLQAQDNGEYTGKCQSDIDTEGRHLSDIVMIPPAKPPLDTTTSKEDEAPAEKSVSVE